MAKLMNTALTVGLGSLALSASSRLATAISIAIRAAIALRPRRPSNRTALLTVTALTAIGLGCGSQEASDPVATTLIDSRSASDRPLPTDGKAHVEYSAGRVTLHCDGSLRLAVLEQLAAQAGFEIIAGRVDAQPITLQIEGAALVDAIALILDGIVYTLEYDFDEASETRVIARVKIGETLEHDTVNPAETAPTDTLQKRDSGIGRTGPPSEANTAEQAELLSELDSSDPRADAADWIDLDGEALARMISLLKSDPDANVRATIVDRLGEEISLATAAALIAAFQDPDPEVVLRAIEALEFDAEPELISELETLLGHPDPEVSEAAQDLIFDLKEL